MMTSKVEIKLNTTDVSRESNYGIIHTQWNKAVVQLLLENTKKELISQGVAADNINCTEVPGAFELPYAAKKMIQQGNLDVIIALGAIIKGETYHFELIANSCSYGLTKVSLESNKPILFGVLTTNTEAEALVRADPEKGNKGAEVARTAMFMLEQLSLNE